MANQINFDYFYKFNGKKEETVSRTDSVHTNLLDSKIGIGKGRGTFWTDLKERTD